MVEEKVFRFNAGDVCVINEDETHLAQSTRGTVSEWSFLSFDPVGMIGPLAGTSPMLDTKTLAGRNFANLLTSGNHPDVVLLVREILQELHGKKKNYQETVRGLIWALMARLHRLPHQQGRRGLIQTRQREARVRMAPALQMMSERYGQPLTLPVLAKSCHGSVPHFRRIFRTATGHAPLEYLNRLRIQMAATMLKNTENKIIDIAADTGFPTLSSFNRLFRRIMRKPPRRWRNE